MRDLSTRILATAILSFITLLSSAQTLHTFSNGEMADANKINHNFNSVVEELKKYAYISDLRDVANTGAVAALTFCGASETSVSHICDCSQSSTPAMLVSCGAGYSDSNNLFGGVAICYPLNGTTTTVARVEVTCMKLRPTALQKVGRNSEGQTSNFDPAEVFNRGLELGNQLTEEKP